MKLHELVMGENYIDHYVGECKLVAQHYSEPSQLIIRDDKEGKLHYTEPCFLSHSLKVG